MNDWNSLVRDFAARLKAEHSLPVVHKAFGSHPLVGHEHLHMADPVLDAPPTPPLSAPRIQRIEDLLANIARSVIKNARISRTAKREYLLGIFQEAIEKECLRIAEISKVDPQAEREKLEVERKTARKTMAEQLAKRRTKARTSLADELRSSRKTLREFQWKIRHAQSVIDSTITAEIKAMRKKLADSLRETRARVTGKRRALENALQLSSQTLWDAHWKRAKPIVDEAAVGRKYPDVPPPMLDPHAAGLGLPDVPGIYFLWRDDAVEYVGQSIRLGGRVRLGSHHIVKEHHRISYVLIEARELTWAECYYIGVLRPVENFGAHASHKKP